MKTVIRFFSVCVCVFFQIGSIFSQSEMLSQSTRLNWIFIIDGMTPDVANANCIIILSQDGFNDTILCKYIVGDVWVPTDKFNQIMENTNDAIGIEFTYIERQYSGPFQYLRYIYPITLYKSFFNSSYILFNIENISIKKRIFSLKISSGDGYVIKWPPYHRRKSPHNAFTRSKHKMQTKHNFTDIIRMNRVP